MSSKPRVITDDDPTIEEEAPEFDPTRTDSLLRASDVSIVATSGDSVGAIEHDDRGEARWKWVTETAGALATEKTFDHLKSLSNDSLALEDAPASAEAEKPSRKTGYNPYDVDGPAGKPQSSGAVKPSKPRK
ncbi:MAG TPA: hypothetical protein VFX89_17660 [Gammaproteobacteria bacterium]|nr:hypothetical protein [Gammaproteobacteria bacterium]